MFVMVTGATLATTDLAHLRFCRLEDVLGEEPLKWVKEQNKVCLDTVGDPTKKPQYRRILNIYDSKVSLQKLDAR